MKANPAILEKWKTLNEGLADLTEDQVWQLLNLERTGQKRLQFLLRLYGRFNILRTDRERKELMALASEAE